MDIKTLKTLIYLSDKELQSIEHERVNIINVKQYDTGDQYHKAWQHNIKKMLHIESIIKELEFELDLMKRDTLV